ncbi:DMT family transporter [Thermovenabulum gondwanense]|uniref:DMT family transporter n=1 Tax=Thermovenabulum gondwanense TaxID=520767 RepID=A0A162N4B8_9FIRM|nr:DMT family transporter [Thermovenabulum gondwanense]KYO69283.1 hypothetical protein ATZ99_00230 [Thermovenabulum gondwanense]
MFNFNLQVYVFIIFAMVSGALMAVQGGMNTGLGKFTGTAGSTFLVHLSAAFIMLMVLLLRIDKANFKNLGRLPWYYFLGGVLGVLITYLVIISMRKLGAGAATTSIIVGQVLTACLIDHFGLFSLEKTPFTWLKLLGLFLLAAGAKLLLNK